jgi:aminocarboxymuconate-semialdehyde decarboxylase
MTQKPVHSCGHNRTPIPVRARNTHLVVDIHCHLGVPAAEAQIRAAIPGFDFEMPFSSPASDAVTGKLFAKIGPVLNGIEQRLVDMDRLGVDIQAVSPSPGQYFYFTDPGLGRDLARTVNDGIAGAVAKHPDRLVGMGTVPMQSPALAITEMRRCVHDLGMRGIEISSHVNGRELAEDDFRPFFAAAEELGILIFLHPLGFTHGQRLSEHYLTNIVGNPLESTIALSHLIFGGVLDAHPGLKLCVAHGGGFLGGYWGRMDHAYHAREECRLHISREPSSYLRDVWFDTLVFDKDELDCLVHTHGADKLCLGTDYPFDMAEPDPVGFHDRLDVETRARILGLNAAALLGLTVEPR